MKRNNTVFATFRCDRFKLFNERFLLLLILTLWHCVTCSVTSSLRLSRYCSLYFLRKINYIRPWSTQISDGDLMEISCNRVTHNSFGIRSCDCKFTFVICSKIYICHIFQNSPLSYLLNSYLSYLLNSHLSYFPKFIFVMFAKIHICHVSRLPKFIFVIFARYTKSWWHK